MSVLDVGVVGAGPAGLIMARRLGQTSATFEVFERNADVGGIWNIDAPGSPMYDTAHFISSRTLSGFVGFPMPGHYPDYPNYRQLLDYIRAFADEFDLRGHVRFNTPVARAAAGPDGGWELQLGTGETRHCRYLICANGVTWVPHHVSWPGQFHGEVRHSVTYRSPEEFAGKRVLVVGAGTSGADIACDASVSADQAFLSVRRGYHFIPKYIAGTPSDVFGQKGPSLPHWLEVRLFQLMLRMINGDLRHYGLPEPDHKLFESHPLMNTQILHYLGHGNCIAKPDVERLDGDHVVFADGSREQIDVVIAATGFQRLIPFLDEGLLEFDRGRPQLYLGIFARNRPNLAALGFVEFASAAYSHFEEMAELIAADATAPPGSPTAQAFKELKANHHPDVRGGRRYIDTDRHADYIEVKAYRKILAKVRKQVGLPKGAHP